MGKGSSRGIIPCLLLTVSCTDSLVEVKNTGCATEDRTVNKPVVMSATSSSEGTSQFGLSTEVQRDVTMDDVNSSKLRSSDSRGHAQGTLSFICIFLLYSTFCWDCQSTVTSLPCFAVVSGYYKFGLKPVSWRPMLK